MVKPAIANLLWCLASGPSCASFTTALNNPAVAQQRILQRFLRKNSASSFGREHGLETVRTAAEFARRVPIRSYDEMRPWIERIQRGEANVLTIDAVRRLVPTSGSTAARKLIPYTAAMHAELNRAIGPWIFDLYRKNPQALIGVSYWSISPALPGQAHSTEDSAIPIGFDDDAAYLGWFRKSLIQASLAAPQELRFISSAEDWRYVTALLLLRRRDLTLLSIWHPFFFSLLLQTIRENWQRLLADISSGECAVNNRLPEAVVTSIKCGPNGKRFEELRAISPASVGKIWPRLQVVSCWADGHATGAATELAESFGTAIIQPKGLLATEGIISIPFRGLHPLAIRSHYLEFEDDSGNVFLAHELRENLEYGVILTTGGGLCRYRLGDRIAVDGMLGRTPSIRFIGKSSQVSDRMGEKLSDGFVGSVFSKLFANWPSSPFFAMLAPDIDADGTHYTLYLNSDAPLEFSTVLDQLLSANPQYAYCRRLGQLRAPRLFLVNTDAAAKYHQRLERTGKRIGEIKPVALSALDDWSNHLSGRYVD